MSYQLQAGLQLTHIRIVIANMSFIKKEEMADTSFSFINFIYFILFVSKVPILELSCAESHCKLFKLTSRYEML